MIKKLRIKFIVIAMISVFVVLAGTIGIINISNKVVIENNAKESLTEVIREGFKDEMNEGPGGGGEPGKNDRLMRNHYYVVEFDNSGNIIKSNYRHIFSINETDGNELARKIYNNELTNGRYQTYRYTKENNVVAVLDIKEELDNFNNFLLLSSTISIGAYLAFAALIILSSYIVFRPAEESYKKQKQFITNASHELKTPLTIISTDLEILEMDNGKNEWSESIRDQVVRLTNMTNQLVTLSKLEENDMKNYPFTDIQVNEVVKKVSDSFASSFLQANINFKVELDNNINFNGNSYLFEELIYIFLDNSLKYTGGKDKYSSIRLVQDKKNHFSIIFKNSLDEKDELDVSLLSERFYRSPSNKKEGSGIGLSIAKEIINLHKGKLDISKDNNEIIFTVSF